MREPAAKLTTKPPAAPESSPLTTSPPTLRTWRVGSYREAPIWDISRQAQANLSYLDLMVALSRRDRNGRVGGCGREQGQVLTRRIAGKPCAANRTDGGTDSASTRVRIVIGCRLDHMT